MAGLTALLALTLSATILHEYSLGAAIAAGIFLLSLPAVEQFSGSPWNGPLPASGWRARPAWVRMDFDWRSARGRIATC